MANKFRIPADVERALRARDTACAYCWKKMKRYLGILGSAKDKATIEHLNRKGPFYWNHGLKVEDLVICCQSCNSSRGTKRLSDWFKSDYCVERHINSTTVAAPVKAYLKRRVSAL
jgi:5-methylcytosine-specific restriction endonuclease McrA